MKKLNEELQNAIHDTHNVTKGTIEMVTKSFEQETKVNGVQLSNSHDKQPTIKENYTNFNRNDMSPTISNELTQSNINSLSMDVEKTQQLKSSFKQY